jgi:hypothetical protein
VPAWQLGRQLFLKGKIMSNVIDGVNFVASALAAIFWFISASGKVPSMGTYFDSAPPNDPFLVAVRRSAVWNRFAAALTGVSVLCPLIKNFI